MLFLLIIRIWFKYVNLTEEVHLIYYSLLSSKMLNLLIFLSVFAPCSSLYSSVVDQKFNQPIESNNCDNYYTQIDPLATNYDLKTQLHDLINPHRVWSYDDVWIAFESVDKFLPGYPCDSNYSHIPDVYSAYCWTTEKITPGGECGNYKKEGVNFNICQVY